jgi:hypothetical protein
MHSSALKVEGYPGFYVDTFRYVNMTDCSRRGQPGRLPAHPMAAGLMAGLSLSVFLVP